MIDTNYDEERDPVRRILRSLPKVRASDDFEARLKRRITEGQPSLQSRLLSRKYVTVYALSMMGLVATAAITYSLFMPEYPRPQGSPENGNGRVSVADTSSKPASPRPESSRTSAGRVAVRERSDTQVFRFRPSPQDEMERRGFLKEVGGAEGRPATSSGESVASPFLQSLPDSLHGLWRDSVARADSARIDSLKRLLNRR